MAKDLRITQKIAQYVCKKSKWSICIFSWLWFLQVNDDDDWLDDVITSQDLRWTARESSCWWFQWNKGWWRSRNRKPLDSLMAQTVSRPEDTSFRLKVLFFSWVSRGKHSSTSLSLLFFVLLVNGMYTLSDNLIELCYTFSVVEKERNAIHPLSFSESDRSSRNWSG